MGKKILKVTAILIVMVMIMILMAAGYIKAFLPNVGPPPELSVELTEENIERGRYLANHVMLCMDCHAERDFTIFAGPPKPGTEGAGGELFDEKLGVPGQFVSRNITPAALGEWTDGEIFRAITSGVSRDGTALFPVMPYPHYSRMDQEDIYAVIAYLRSLEPIEHDVPPAKIDFPVSFLINTMPVKTSFQKRPPADDIINYGEYLVTAAACTDCHTKMEKGAYVGEMFAGGNEYPMPNGTVVRAANLTPHETGIGNWTKEQFIHRFKAFSDSSYVPKKVAQGEFQTIMPWLMYSEMKREDLEAIYEYLKTLSPVNNPVKTFTAGG